MVINNEVIYPSGYCAYCLMSTGNCICMEEGIWWKEENNED